jgi:hypothetical protein
VRKSAYYRRAMLRAALIAQIGLGAVGLAAWMLYVLSLAPSEVAAGYDVAASRMLFVLAPYAFVVLGALAVRQLPVVDVKALMNVTILGPFTALRPLVLVSGVALAVSAVPAAKTALLGAMGLACAFGLGPLLTWLRKGVLVVD